MRGSIESILSVKNATPNIVYAGEHPTLRERKPYLQNNKTTLETGITYEYD